MSDDLQLEDKKQYEVSFLLPSEEAAQEVIKEMGAHKLEIVEKGPITSIKFAYPVKKHESGYFGFLYVVGMPQDMVACRESLRTNKNILRLMVITPPIKVVSHEQRFSRDGRRAVSQKEVVVPKTEEQKPTPAVGVVLSNEGLEKELQQILQ